MGACCCCCGCASSEDNANATSEMEMKAKKTAKAMAIAKHMSAPTIRVGNDSEISGSGLALVGVPLEQDHAYWEWHIELPPKVHLDTVLFGVTTKKTNKFYKELADKVQPEEGVASDVNGTNWMRRIELQHGDVVGVAMQQSDLPMIQFFLNGETLHESAINRFRGTVYPAICLPESESEELHVHFIMDEDEFKQKEQGRKFGPIIPARSIV